MATYLTVTATHDGSVSNRIVREALRGVDPDDISVSSPIPSASSLSTAHEVVETEGDEPTYRFHVRSGERDEEFTWTTTDAIVAAISTLDGVTDVTVDGGYEPPEGDGGNAVDSD